MNNRHQSPGLLTFLRYSDKNQIEAFKSTDKYKIDFREDIPLSDGFIPAHLNALVGHGPGSGFSLVEPTRVRSFQYAHLQKCEARGEGFEQCRIEVGTNVIELEGRNLDRLVNLLTEHLLRKLYLPANFEESHADLGPREMTWISKVNVTNATKDQE